MTLLTPAGSAGGGAATASSLSHAKGVVTWNGSKYCRASKRSSAGAAGSRRRRFSAWTGILVNRHRASAGRTGDTSLAEPLAACDPRQAPGRAFVSLKKEHAVSWRDRWRNAWHGFGWCATAVREAAMLQALRAANVGCPEVAAFGEDRRAAFVLLREAEGMTELRTFLPTLESEHERRRLVRRSGARAGPHARRGLRASRSVRQAHPHQPVKRRRQLSLLHSRLAAWPTLQARGLAVALPGSGDSRCDVDGGAGE